MINEFLKTDISPFEVLLSLRPGASFTITGISPNGPAKFSDQNIQWNSTDILMPTPEEYDAEYLRLKTELDQKMYRQLREKEYPSIGDQLDALYHAGIFPEEMAERIKAVKDRYPKGGQQ